MSVTYSDEATKAIKGMVSEVSAAMTRMEGERDLISESIKEVAKNHGIEPKVLRKLANIYHKQMYHTVKTENETVEESYAFLYNPDQNLNGDADNE